VAQTQLQRVMQYAKSGAQAIGNHGRRNVGGRIAMAVQTALRLQMWIARWVSGPSGVLVQKLVAPVPRNGRAPSRFRPREAEALALPIWKKQQPVFSRIVQSLQWIA